VTTSHATTLPSRKGSARRRAAITLVALGAERASSVLRGLDEGEVTALLSEVTRLGVVDQAEIRNALADLDKGLPQTRTLAAPTAQFANDVLVRTVGTERAAALSAALNRPPAFAWLAAVDVATAGPVVAEYPPHVLAVAFAHLEPQLVAQLMTALTPDTRMAVAVRLAGLRTLHPETVMEIEDRMRARFARIDVDSAAAPVSGPQLLAEILTRSEREAGKEVLSALAAVSSELADEVRALLFTFEDLAALPARALQQVLAATQARDLAIALKDAPDQVHSTLLANLSERNRDNLLEEIELLESITPAESKAARAAVVAVARRLEDAGNITLDRPETGG
jgi:flagellar motor switch protein FliG